MSHPSSTIPTLPQKDTAQGQKDRAFQLSIARTNYNFMHTYLDHVPMSASLPDSEKFDLSFIEKTLKVIRPMFANFQKVVVMLLKRELESDLPTVELEALRAAYEKLRAEFSVLKPVQDIKDIHEFMGDLLAAMEALKRATRIPGDLERMASGLKAVFEDFAANGPTAFLKSTLFDMLSQDHGRNYLHAESIDDYEMLFDSLQKPMMLQIAQQPWMVGNEKPCEQDWFFGYLQIAGYNTTNLLGIVASAAADSDAVVLSDLQKKCPISDQILQKVLGNSHATLQDAIAQKRLYVVDYTQFATAYADSLHGEQRYITAPIAVFYWNPEAPAGYPPGVGGVLQPICIQLGQHFDAESTPIFTPNDVAGGNDPQHLKWKIAKYFVNALGAMQHESIAHLGDCHLIVEPIIVAANRQLAENHPLLTLLKPHFKFTININDDAIHSLIVPGGVVATNVGPAIECSLAAVSAAHAAYRWDQRHPERLFKRRGVDALPQFPFRDDTLLLFTSLRPFVASYLQCYYQNDQDVRDDFELQAFFNELVLPRFAGFKGMEGLRSTNDPNAPVAIDSLEYLIDVVAQIIYIAGPQHASVNYAQYALMSYMPSVAGTIYSPPPTRSQPLTDPKECLKWYPPLDVALYTFSFEYLLTQVQYDTFGHYDADPRTPYFADPRIAPHAADFRDALALAEIEIRNRNRSRPMEYLFQLPSKIPNSVSI